MTPTDEPDDRIDRLILDYLDGVTSEAEVRELTAALKHPEIQRRFAALATDHAHLRELGQQKSIGWLSSVRVNAASAEDDEPESRPSRRRARVSLRMPRRRSNAGWLVAALLMLAAAGAAFVLLRSSSKPSTPVATVPTSMTVAEASGRVLVNGTPVGAGHVLKEGEDVHTEGASSEAVVAFADGTRIRLHGDSVCDAVTTKNGIAFRLESGSISATVLPQPAGRPMTIETSHGRATVVGTVFTLRSDADITQLNVDEGRVKLLRLADSVETEVAAGFFAAVGKRVPTVTGPAREAIALYVGFVDGKTLARWPGLYPLVDGAELSASTIPKSGLNVRAVLNVPRAGSVRFGYDGNPNFWVEDSPPYELIGRDRSLVKPWVPGVGTHTITVTPHAGAKVDDNKATGAAGRAYSIKFRVVDK